MFPEDGNFLNPSFPIHRRSSVSRGELDLNYEDGHVACTTPITIENCAASTFNENTKEFQDIIANKVRVLLKCHEENEENRFLCPRLLRATHEEMFAIRFCEHCNMTYAKGLKTDVFTDE